MPRPMITLVLSCKPQSSVGLPCDDMSFANSGGRTNDHTSGRRRQLFIDIGKIFRDHNINAAACLITMHVDNANDWAESDLKDDRNRITLLWHLERQNPTLDKVNADLERKRVLSDVWSFPYECFFLFNGSPHRVPSWQVLNINRLTCTCDVLMLPYSPL